MQQYIQPITKDLVLIGSHSHAIALLMFGMKPLDGIRLTLITDRVDTPYSGMLPGHIAGFYRYEECHIDLQRLTNFAKAQVYIDRVIGLDLENKKVICANRPEVEFDLLSIDIGSTPARISVPGAAEYTISKTSVRFTATLVSITRKSSCSSAKTLEYWDCRGRGWWRGISVIDASSFVSGVQSLSPQILLKQRIYE